MYYPIARQTPEQRANLLHALNVMWPSIKPEQVAHRLSYWADAGHSYPCGTVACFGGHVALDPYFQARGVGRSFPDGAPIMVKRNTMESPVVSQQLFGWDDMFCIRGMCTYDNEDPFDNEPVSDHEFVRRRLQRLLNNSVVVE